MGDVGDCGRADLVVDMLCGVDTDLVRNSR